MSQKFQLCESRGFVVGLLLGCLVAGTVMPLSAQTDRFTSLRRQMVDEQIRQRGVKDPGVIAAMLEVPRHHFVPQGYQNEAYADHPVPIGEGQTISQPFIVAAMTSLLDLQGGEKILEVGTGSGYQAAVLAKLVDEVYTIEILEPLAKRAKKALADIGYRNVHVRTGDGYNGWPEEAPFDGIVVTAAPEQIPEPLVEQLKMGGKMVIPVGNFFQDLIVVTKTKDGIKQRKEFGVRFVPMTGEIEEQEPN